MTRPLQVYLVTQEAPQGGDAELLQKEVDEVLALARAPNSHIPKIEQVKPAIEYHVVWVHAQHLDL